MLGAKHFLGEEDPQAMLAKGKQGQCDASEDLDSESLPFNWLNTKGNDASHCCGHPSHRSSRSMANMNMRRLSDIGRRLRRKHDETQCCQALNTLCMHMHIIAITIAVQPLRQNQNQNFWTMLLLNKRRLPFEQVIRRRLGRKQGPSSNGFRCD